LSYGRYNTPLVTRTEEEQVVYVLRIIGPVIALGKPGDPLPELGAARRYLKPEEDWQGVVKEWMAQASVVVVHAGDSPGLLQELEIARDALSHEQLLLLLSINDEEYLRFKKKIEAIWSIHFPDSIGRPLLGSITGCIYFTPGWSPHFLEVKNMPSAAKSRQPLAHILKSVLQPFFDQFEQVSAKSSRAMQENRRLTRRGQPRARN
jgi:hypothetical protein